ACILSTPAPSSTFFLSAAAMTTHLYTLSLHDALPISTADSARQDAHVLGSCAITWQAQGRPGRGESLRHEPRVHRGAVPSRHTRDRKSTRLNSSHLGISYAVFCLKKKI